jgi:hypothetical protein
VAPDNQLDEVVDAPRLGGHDQLAEELRQDLVGIDVLDGQWTFQAVEEFDDGLYARWRSWEQRVRRETVCGGHVHEAQITKEGRPERAYLGQVLAHRPCRPATTP